MVGSKVMHIIIAHGGRRAWELGYIGSHGVHTTGVSNTYRH